MSIVIFSKSIVVWLESLSVESIHISSISESIIISSFISKSSHKSVISVVSSIISISSIVSIGSEIGIKSGSGSIFISSTGGKSFGCGSCSSVTISSQIIGVSVKSSVSSGRIVRTSNLDDLSLQRTHLFLTRAHSLLKRTLLALTTGQFTRFAHQLSVLLLQGIQLILQVLNLGFQIALSHFTTAQFSLSLLTLL